MLIYEVNLTVDESVAPRYSTWLREHVRDLLELDGFEAAAWYVRSDDADTIPEGDAPEGPREWTLHYQVRDADALQAYFNEHAAEFRQDGRSEFEEHVTIDRRILEHRRLFHAQDVEDTGPMA
jgi:hypothetical protein